MGNKSENEITNVEKQDSFYHLVNLEGEGILVGLANQARHTQNYSELDKIIKCKIGPFLYEEGNGKQLPVSEMIRYRSRSRPIRKIPRLQPEQHVIESEGDGRELEKMKFTCWDLNARGLVGETGLHVCLLLGTQDHTCLAKRMLRVFPALIHDIYLDDEYYGENVLHMAIANEDPQMVRFLISQGVGVQERASGALFSPSDQKLSRRDITNDFAVEVQTKTDYKGMESKVSFDLEVE
jgi:transient receptor potential cation channel subfamily V protein 5